MRLLFVLLIGFCLISCQGKTPPASLENPTTPKPPATSSVPKAKPSEAEIEVTTPQEIGPLCKKVEALTGITINKPILLGLYPKEALKTLNALIEFSKEGLFKDHQIKSITIASIDDGFWESVNLEGEVVIYFIYEQNRKPFLKERLRIAVEQSQKLNRYANEIEDFKKFYESQPRIPLFISKKVPVAPLVHNLALLKKLLETNPSLFRSDFIKELRITFRSELALDHRKQVELGFREWPSERKLLEFLSRESDAKRYFNDLIVEKEILKKFKDNSIDIENLYFSKLDYLSWVKTLERFSQVGKIEFLKKKGVNKIIFWACSRPRIEDSKLNVPMDFFSSDLEDVLK
jgi:hypothetical protein